MFSIFVYGNVVPVASFYVFEFVRTILVHHQHTKAGRNMPPQNSHAFVLFHYSCFCTQTIPYLFLLIIFTSIHLYIYTCWYRHKRRTRSVRNSLFTIFFNISLRLDIFLSVNKKEHCLDGIICARKHSCRGVSARKEISGSVTAKSTSCEREEQRGSALTEQMLLGQPNPSVSSRRIHETHRA